MYSEKIELGQGFYWCRPTSKLWRALTSPWTVWVCSNRPVDDSREFTVSQMPSWNSSSDLWFLILKQKSKQTPQKLTFLLPTCRNGTGVMSQPCSTQRAEPHRWELHSKRPCDLVWSPHPGKGTSTASSSVWRNKSSLSPTLIPWRS